MLPIVTMISEEELFFFSSLKMVLCRNDSNEELFLTTTIYLDSTLEKLRPCTKVACHPVSYDPWYDPLSYFQLH